MDEYGEPNELWRKSSYSGGSGACVEVAGTFPGFIAVRDSKNAASAELSFSSQEWTMFMSRVKES